MAFPTVTTVIDNFNRADGPAGANWTADAAGFGDAIFQVISNTAGSSVSGGQDGWYNATTYGPDSEAMETLPTEQATLTVGLTLRQQSAGNCYLLAIDKSGTPDTWTIYRDVAGALTSVATGSQDIAGTDAIGFEALGNVISAYWQSGGAGGWTQIATGTDNQYGGTGKLGKYIEGTTRRQDDFRGGTTVPAAGGGLPTGTQMSLTGAGR